MKWMKKEYKKETRGLKNRYWDKTRTKDTASKQRLKMNSTRDGNSPDIEYTEACSIKVREHLEMALKWVEGIINLRENYKWRKRSLKA